MRDIKFRGKELEKDEWIYGYLFYDYDAYDYYSPFITWKDDSCLGGCGEEQVQKDTIGEYTGLKDKNGKEIYEGDIIKYTDNYIAPEDWFDGDDENSWEISVVKWYGDEDYPAFDFKNNFESNGFSYIDFNDGMVEVIGNIYDNPELVKEIENQKNI